MLICVVCGRYRDQWACGEDQVCHGVGIKVETYTGDPPDILVKRSDPGCNFYTFIDIFNQLTGKVHALTYIHFTFVDVYDIDHNVLSCVAVCRGATGGSRLGGCGGDPDGATGLSACQVLLL